MLYTRITPEGYSGLRSTAAEAIYIVYYLKELLGSSRKLGEEKN